MSGGLHASAILVGERGVLLRGPSGAGKSLLALELIARVGRQGGFAALVGDDRIWLEAHDGRLLAHGAAATAGLCERRGLGLLSVAHEREAVVRLVADLFPCGEPAPRMPDAASLYDNLCGVRLPRLALDMALSLDGAASAVLAGLERISGGVWRKNPSQDEVFA